MTQESCNADKKEAEILKPSATSSMSIKPGTIERFSADVTLGAEGSQLSFRLIERCWTCRKRVGLFKGFRCRCGELLCRRHRFSDTHDCSFDYKAAGKEEIYKANPLVRASKIIKI